MDEYPRYYDYDGDPISFEVWVELFEARTENLVRWRVAETDIGDIKVSTVWLGLDHNFMFEGPPLIFESVVFGGALDDEMRRYSTVEEAEKGHWDLVEKVKLALQVEEVLKGVSE